MKYLATIVMGFFLVLFLLPANGKGQDHQADHKVNIKIPEVALLGITATETGHSEIIIAAPNEAGSPVNLKNVPFNKGIWVNYSSIILSPNHRRKVIAAVQGEIPSGLRLAVKADEATGEGRGMLGNSAGMVYLSEEPTEVISGIGSCYTGKGPNNGHLLSYQLVADNNAKNVAHLTESQTTLHVIYTLTDHN